MTDINDEDLARAIDPGAFTDCDLHEHFDRLMNLRRGLAFGAAMRVQTLLRRGAQNMRKEDAE